MLLDFTNVEYLSSAELGTILALHQKLKGCDGRLTLFNLSVQVFEVFWLSQLQRRLDICRE
jgi:anti-anti-sigma factor